MPKVYNKAPLPFVGQKRMFLKEFRQALANIPGDGAGWTIVDAFGGSGLLSHVAAREKPAARVIYNDYDGYADRLRHIPDYNRLREQLARIVGDTPREVRLSAQQEADAKRAIIEFDGHIDLRVLSSFILFSVKQAASLDQLLGYEFYNKIRQSPIPTADDYLDGLEIVRQDFAYLLAEHTGSANTLLVLDPPYLSTMQGAYANDKFFGMVDFLRLIRLTRPPFILFGSTRSEVLDYFDYLEEYEPAEYERFAGFDVLQKQIKMSGNGVEYEDNMLIKF